MELLFVRLPLLLRAPAIRRASKFLLENTFSSVTSEAAVLCNAIAWADSAVTSESLLTPLLASLQRDAAAIGAAASSERLSKVQETSFKWRLNLLSSSGFHMGAALVPHGPAIRAVLTSLFSAPSQAVQEAAGRALSSLLVGLTAYYPKGQYAALPGRLAPTNSEETDAVHLECYIDKIGNGCEGGVSGSGGCTGGMAWHVPSPEEIDLANEFLQEFLEAPSDKLLQLCSGGAGAPSKDVVRSLMLQLEGALGGVRSCLPDFPECSAAAIPDSVAVVGRLGAVVGSPQLREKAAAALVAASHAIAPSDAETLGLCIRVMDLAVAVGSAEHAMAEGSASAWASDDRWLQEPAVAGMLLESMADELSTHSVGYGPKWRRRRPMWLAQEKVYLNLEWRASQAAYRWYASASQPAFDPAKLPKVYLEVLSRSVHFVVRGLRSVRDTAAAIVERAAKRYPRLAPALVAPVFAALAKVEDLLEFDPGRTTSDILPRLRQAAQQAPALAAAAAGETGECHRVACQGGIQRKIAVLSDHVARLGCINGAIAAVPPDNRQC